ARVDQHIVAARVGDADAARPGIDAQRAIRVLRAHARRVHVDVQTALDTVRSDLTDTEVHGDVAAGGDQDAQVRMRLRAATGTTDRHALPTSAAAKRAITAHAQLRRAAARAVVHHVAFRIAHDECGAAVHLRALDLQPLRVAAATHHLDHDVG